MRISPVQGPHLEHAVPATGTLDQTEFLADNFRINSFKVGAGELYRTFALGIPLTNRPKRHDLSRCRRQANGIQRTIDIKIQRRAIAPGCTLPGCLVGYILQGTGPAQS